MVAVPALSEYRTRLTGLPGPTRIGNASYAAQLSGYVLAEREALCYLGGVADPFDIYREELERRDVAPAARERYVQCLAVRGSIAGPCTGRSPA